MNIETATLAGGCFWCLEAVFVRLRGVESVTSGYCGGHTPHPSYEAVCSEETGHAEVVQIRFDPDVISYADLLDIFFAIHDPTTPDQQGNDIGNQYRSVIFTHDAQQEEIARSTIASLEAAPVFPEKIVTHIQTAAPFYPAEAEHQNYYALHPRQAYCQWVIAPKLEKLAHLFSPKLKS